MRPHRLALQAFGPFPGEVEVDLDVLAAGGLFLLHGDTGAGKTTLLDAIGYGLYGQVPGARMKAGRLRSDHASPDVPTRVVLEFTAAGRRLRVTRSPEQTRPRRRGTGVTTAPAAVLLEEHRGAVWEPLSTRVGEADDELARVLGMSASQFFQVVLLPQGEFARFLRADAPERTALLQRLFGTERFDAVERWLAARRRDTAESYGVARAAHEAVVARLAEEAGVDAPSPPPPGWVGGLLAAAATRTAAATADRAAAGAEVAAARQARDTAESLARRQARRRELLARRDALAGDAADHARAADELARADRAALVAVALDALDVARRAAEDARGSHTAALARAGAPDDLVAALSAARDRLGVLAGLQPRADLAGARRGEADHAEAQAAVLTARIEQLAAAAAVVPGQRAEAVAVLEATDVAARDLPTARAELARARAVAADLDHLDAVAAERADLEVRLLATREALAAARERRTDIRQARLDDAATEFAALLVDGAPCYVCGSPDHPEPAAFPRSSFTRADEAAATAEADRLERDVEPLRERAADLAADLTATSERVAAALVDDAGLHTTDATAAAHGAAADAPAAVAWVARAEAALTALQDTADRRPAARDRIVALEATASGLDADLRAAGAERDRLLDVASERRRAAAADTDVLAAHGVDDGDLTGAVRACRVRVSVLEEALRTAEEAARRAADLDRATDDAAARARAAGFTDAADAAAGVRDRAWRETTAAALRSHREAVAAVAHAIADPELAVDLVPAADVVGATARLAEVTAAHDDAVRRALRAEDRAARLAGLAPRLAEVAATLAPLQAAAEVARELADLAAGTSTGNTFRMSLSAYVLAARLEEVAALASARLTAMTAGRYTLVHSDAVGRGRARSGLGLVVRDAWTGADRDTATLSGGETFLASLALALGLADAVTAEAGGAPIETLFVDEGFGSLDEDTLDEVMDVLDGLREGGRLVGLVSHVAELRARVPTHLVVRKGRRGSVVDAPAA